MREYSPARLHVKEICIPSGIDLYAMDVAHLTSVLRRGGCQRDEVQEDLK